MASTFAAKPGPAAAGRRLQDDQLRSSIASGNIDCNPERQQVDPRLAFLLRAAVKLHLVEGCYQDLDAAFADLVLAFRQIAVPPCQCEREMLASFERFDSSLRRRRPRKPWWRRR